MKNKDLVVDEETAVEIDRLPVLSEFLPFRFGNGSIIERLETNCASCGQVLSAATIKARPVLVVGGTAVRLEAYGLCYTCRTITPISARLGEDGTALFRTKAGWTEQRWDRWEQQRPRFLSAIQSILKLIVPPSIALIIWILWAWTR